MELIPFQLCFSTSLSLLIYKNTADFNVKMEAEWETGFSCDKVVADIDILLLLLDRM